MSRIRGIKGVGGYKGYGHSRGTPKAKNWSKAAKGATGKSSPQTREKGDRK